MGTWGHHNAEMGTCGRGDMLVRLGPGGTEWADSVSAVSAGLCSMVMLVYALTVLAHGNGVIDPVSMGKYGYERLS